MTHGYRPARVYTVATALHSSAAEPPLQPDVIHSLKEALVQRGVSACILDRELRVVWSCQQPNELARRLPLASLTSGQSLLSCVGHGQRETVRAACEAVLQGHRAQARCEMISDTDAARTELLIMAARSHEGRIVGVTLTVWPIAEPSAPPDQTYQRNAPLQLLKHTAERLAWELDEDAIVHIVTETLVAQLGLAFARIWLFDAASAALVLRSSSGLYTRIDGEFARILLGQHVVGQIAASRTPLITNDVASTPGLGDREWALASGMRGFAGYPLLARDRLIGVIGFFSYTLLDQQLLAALEPLAYQVALALERAQLSLAQAAAQDQAQALAAVANTRAAQLSATLAAMADGVWTCDRRGRLLTVNSAALQMLGLDPLTSRLETLDDIGALFTPDSAQRELCLGLPAALEGRTVRRELALRLTQAASGAALTVMVTATPMRDSNGLVIGAVAVVRNITQQKLMERLRDDFLSVAAHELKTPVTAIKGYAQLALMRLKTGGSIGTLQRALQTIEEQAQRIAHLVDDLVDVSRIQGGRLELRPEPLDLVGLVRRTLERVRHSTPQHDLTLHAPPSLGLVADERRIEQVLQNLLENAIKYSPDGSTIQVAVECSDGLASVTVVDHGIGIPREKQAHVFETWFQAHGDTVGDFGGMGLGLSICKEIVERHGGSIWVESAQDQGSRFSFTLPLPHDHVERQDPLRAPRAER